MHVIAPEGRTGVWRAVVHGVGAPFFGSAPVCFYSNDSVDACIKRFQANVDAREYANPPRIVVDARTVRIFIAWPLWWLRWQLPVFRGSLFDAGSWTELRGRFTLRWFPRVWFGFWQAALSLIAIDFALQGAAETFIIPLVWLGGCELVWWSGDHDRTAISAYISTIMNMPLREAAADARGEMV